MTVDPFDLYRVGGEEISMFVMAEEGKEGAGLVLLPSSGKEESRQLFIKVEEKKES